MKFPKIALKPIFKDPVFWLCVAASLAIGFVCAGCSGMEVSVKSGKFEPKALSAVGKVVAAATGFDWITPILSLIGGTGVGAVPSTVRHKNKAAKAAASPAPKV